MSDDADKLAAEYHLSNGPAGKLARVYQEARREIERLKKWTDQDEPLPEDAEILRHHPVENDNHASYVEAMRLVGAKRSKGALVDLTNWLLQRATAAESALAALREQAERDAEAAINSRPYWQVVLNRCRQQFEERESMKAHPLRNTHINDVPVVAADLYCEAWDIKPPSPPAPRSPAMDLDDAILALTPEAE